MEESYDDLLLFCSNSFVLYSWLLTNIPTAAAARFGIWSNPFSPSRIASLSPRLLLVGLLLCNYNHFLFWQMQIRAGLTLSWLVIMISPPLFFQKSSSNAVVGIPQLLRLFFYLFIFSNCSFLHSLIQQIYTERERKGVHCKIKEEMEKTCGIPTSRSTHLLLGGNFKRSRSTENFLPKTDSSLSKYMIECGGRIKREKEK